MPYRPDRRPLPPIEVLEDRRLMTADFDIGINMNFSGAADVEPGTKILSNLGVQTVRIYTTIPDFTKPAMTNPLQRAIDYHNKGFNVTLGIGNANANVTDPVAVQNWFTWAVGQPELKDAVDQWEIGNEPDNVKFWKGTLPDYVSLFLKPAAEILRPAGEEVMNGGPSWNPNDVQTMINAGLLDYVDYVGFHPYAPGVAAVASSVAKINQVVAGRKPIAATEWNVRGFEADTDRTNWANAVQQAFPIVRDGFALSYYFAMKVVVSLAGPAGIVNSDMTPNPPFYNAFATFSGHSGSISGVLFNDNNVPDGVYNSGDTITGSRVVYLDANANGKLDTGERSVNSAADGSYGFNGLAPGTYNVARVFPTGYRLSNGVNNYVSVTLANGQQLTGVNVGSVPNTAPPVVLPLTVHDGSVGRSVVRSVTVNFNQPVTLTGNAFTLVRRAAGRAPAAAVGLTYAAVPGSNNASYTLTFTGAGVTGGSVDDGVYDVTVSAASVRTALNVALTADKAVTFKRLFGDGDGDGGVSIIDFNALSTAFGKRAGDPAFNPAFDYDNDGGISVIDFNELVVRFGRSL